MSEMDLTSDPPDPPRGKIAALLTRLQQAELRERTLLAVLDSARDLVAMRDLEQVLQGIVVRARQLVGAHAAFLASYAPERPGFYVRATDGAVSVRRPTLTLPRGYGMISVIAETRVPRQTSRYLEDEGFEHYPEKDAILREEGVESVLGVPVPFGSDAEGVLFVCDRYPRTYLGWEIAMLSTLAAHAAVAMHNARAFEEGRAALHQAGEANARLQKQAAGIRLAADAHEELTALVAKGGGPEDIARVLASMLKGEVLILDEGGRPLAAATAPVNPEAAPAERPVADPRAAYQAHREPIRAAVRESRMAGRSLEVSPTTRGTCRVAAVVGSSGILGGMVIWTREPLDEFAIRILERSAAVTGVVLLSQERLELAASRDRAAILRGLLHWHQDDLPGLTARAARHGVDIRGAVVLAAVEVEGSRASYVLRQLRASAGLEAMLLDEIDGLLVVLSAGAKPGLVRETLGRRLRDLGGQVTGVVSQVVAHVSELPRVYESLRRCLGLLRKLERTGTIASEAQLRAYALAFERLGREEINAFFEATIGKLLEADRNRGSALATTLLAYLDHEHNARHTAAALGIHVNTLRQRFAQVDDLLGDWRTGTCALDVHLALRLWQLRGGSGH